MHSKWKNQDSKLSAKKKKKGNFYLLNKNLVITVLCFKYSDWLLPSLVSLYWMLNKYVKIWLSDRRMKKAVSSSKT